MVDSIAFWCYTVSIIIKKQRAKMSKTKNWLMDMEEEFYTIAEKKIGDCETESEFADKMDAHNDLMTGLYSLDEYNEIVSEMWQEFWSKYN